MSVKPLSCHVYKALLHTSQILYSLPEIVIAGLYFILVSQKNLQWDFNAC